MGRSPIKWRRRSDINIAVDWDAKPHDEPEVHGPRNSLQFTAKINCRMTERAVTHQRISETRAGRVEKIAKFHIRQTHVGNTFKTRYKRVGYAWCTSGARRCTSLKVSARFARVWAKKIFKHA